MQQSHRFDCAVAWRPKGNCHQPRRHLESIADGDGCRTVAIANTNPVAI